MRARSFGLTRLLAGLAVGILSSFAVAATGTADHAKFKELQGPFKSGEEVTAACLACHTEAAKQVMATRHWTWEYVNPDTGQKLGKKTMLNGFCIGDRSNEPFCQSCHIGYGWKDASFDFGDEKKVDCLACHNTGAYRKLAGYAGHPPYERTEFPAKSGKFVEAVDLAKVAQNVGATSRQTCGACHYYGGGGDGVKHGDLDSSLNKPSKELDVHMAVDGLNFSCASCHKTDEHKVAGSRISMTGADPHGAIIRGEKTDRNPATCQACHGDRPHKGGFAHAERLNDHTRTLACQTCHIPEFARGGVPTKMGWDWSTAGKLTPEGKPFQNKDEKGHIIYDSKKGDFVLGENVTPDYLWFDGKAMYEKECIECHKANGEGVKDKFYPVLAGQHYKYLLRQMTEIRDGHRRNANPDMVKIIKKYDNAQLVAISAYQASLTMPGSMCKAGPAAKGGKKK